MKYLFFILLIILSCNNGSNHSPTIIHKFNVSYTNDPLARGICRFYYTDKNGNQKEFTDSCSKYNVLDTIVGRKRAY